MFQVSLAGQLSREEIISSTSMGCCSEGPADLTVRGVLWEATLQDFLDDLGVVLGVANLNCEGEEEALSCICLLYTSPSPRD